MGARKDPPPILPPVRAAKTSWVLVKKMVSTNPKIKRDFNQNLFFGLGRLNMRYNYVNVFTMIARSLTVSIFSIF